jgi:hypothetical protein
LAAVGLVALALTTVSLVVDLMVALVDPQPYQQLVSKQLLPLAALAVKTAVVVVVLTVRLVSLPASAVVVTAVH